MLSVTKFVIKTSKNQTNLQIPI